MKYWLLRICLACIPFSVQAQWDYPQYDVLKNQIDKLGGHAQVQRLSLGKTFAGEDIPLLKIQEGKAPKPTLLIVAGVDGKHAAGTIQAVQVAQHILGLAPADLQALLAQKSIWIVPVLNVDAYKRNGKGLDWGSGNGRSIDNDRDGRMNEEPNKDLNADGFISQMRVRVPVGPYKPHAQQQDLLVLADRSKSETGQYMVFREGLDQDQDGLYGEDGNIGVNLDRNFSFDYPFFEPETGDYAASEPETRAIIDLIFDNPQIATVLHFGLQNNLSVAEQFDARRASERISSSWTNSDAQISALITKRYQEAVKALGEAPKMPAGKGNFSSTVYYHTGKFSFVTPGWWLPLQADTSKNAAKVYQINDDDRLVNWLKQHQVQGAILPWTKVDHPSFPNQEVEVGGLLEQFRMNPPVRFLEESAKLHSNFVLELAKAMAVLEFSEPKITPLGDDVFRVEIRLFNTGAMPVYPEFADRIKHVSKMKSILELDKSQKFLSGKRLQLYPSLKAGESQSYSWLVKGKGKASLTIGCPTAGEKTLSINL